MTTSVFDLAKQYQNVMNGISYRSAGSGDIDVLLNIKRDVSNFTKTMQQPDMMPARNVIPYAERARQNQKAAPLFVGDLYTGDNNLMRNVINVPTLSASQYADMQFANRAVNKPGCINSSFSNQLNQAQFRSNADVVMMQTDSGAVVPLDHAGDASNACLRPCSDKAAQFQDSWTPLNAPVLASVSKQAFMDNMSLEYDRQQAMKAQNQLQAQQQIQSQNGPKFQENWVDTANTNWKAEVWKQQAQQAQQAQQQGNYKLQENWSAHSLNNPANAIWRPLDSKYLN